MQAARGTPTHKPCEVQHTDLTEARLLARVVVALKRPVYHVRVRAVLGCKVVVKVRLATRECHAGQHHHLQHLFASATVHFLQLLRAVVGGAP